MTDGRHPTSGCLDPETLAAFIDGRLEPGKRAAVEAHLADCEDCYEVWRDAVSESGQRAGTGGTAEKGRRRVWLLRTLGVAAAVMLAVWFRPVSDDVRTQRALDALVAAVGQQRPALGRFSVHFDWAAVRPPTRSPSDESSSLAVQGAALSIRVLAAESESPAHKRALGIAEIADGNLDVGIGALEAAAAAEPATPDVRADLSAALLERWYRSRSAEDATRALNEARLAVAESPTHLAALFNVALAAEAVGDRQGAVGAWKSYLAQDSTSPWADEARQRMEDLERTVRPPESALRLIERSLMDWANLVITAQTAQLPEPAGQDLVSELRDPQLARLFAAATSSVRTGQPNPRVLAAALRTMQRSREKFDISEYGEAAAEAREAARLIRSIGLPALDAEMQEAWSLFFERRGEGMALASRVMSAATSASIPRLRGRYEYMAGLEALRVGFRTEASEHYGAAVAVYEQAGDVEQVAATHVVWAEALREQGDDEGNWEHVSLALSALPQLSTPRRRIHILGTTTQSAIQAGYDGAALWFSERLAEEVSETTDPSAHITLHLLRAPLLARLGDLNGARQSFTAGLAATEGSPSREQELRFRAEIGWREGVALYQDAPEDAIRGLNAALEAFDGLAAAAGSKDPDEEGNGHPFRLAEVHLYRGRAYKAADQITDAQADWMTGIDLLRSQAGGIKDRRLRTAWADSLWGLFSELIESHIDEPMTALAWLERSRDALDGGTAWSSPSTITPVAIKASDFGADIVVVLASLPGQLLRWTFDGGAPVFLATPVGTAQLSDLREAYVSALAAGRRPDAEVETRLSELLLPARLPSQRDASVIFVSDGPLRLFPFAALRHPATGRYLVEDTIPRLVSSLKGATLASPKPANTGRPLLVGVSATGGETALRYLPDARAEVQAIARIYQSESPQLLIDSQATRQAVLAQLPSAGMVHLATHAIVHPEQNKAALVFFGGGTPDTLTADDIVEQRLRPGTLVVLSACETAVGPVTASNSSVSLAHAFLHAGASAVLGTLWEIPDDEARRLMTLTHERLHSGRPSHMALAEAQRLMLESNPNSRVWAAVAHISS